MGKKLLYLRGPFLQMQELLIRPLKRDFNEVLMEVTLYIALAFRCSNNSLEFF